MSDPRAITISPGLLSTSSDEVERVLSALMLRREPLAALILDGESSSWRIVFVDAKREYIVVGPVSGGCEPLLQTQHVTFLAEFGGTNIEFTASSPSVVTHEKAKAVRLSFPKVTVSRQRRAHPRAEVPTDSPVHCTIPAGAGVALEGQLMDISEGGIGLLIRASYLVPAPDTLIRGWRIELPEGEVTVDLQVRHCRPVVLADGSHAHRWGCQFVDPSDEVKELIRVLAGGRQGR